MKIREDYGHEWSQEGDVAFNEKKFELARKAYSEASKYVPENPFILFKLGRTLDAMNRSSEAREYYGRALRIKPDLNEDLFVQMDNKLREQLKIKQEKTTDDKFNSIKKTSPVKEKINFKSVLSEGDKLAEAGKSAEALVKYRICQKEDPTDPSIIARISAISFCLGNENAAENAILNLKSVNTSRKKELTNLINQIKPDTLPVGNNRITKELSDLKFPDTITEQSETDKNSLEGGQTGEHCIDSINMMSEAGKKIKQTNKLKSDLETDTFNFTEQGSDSRPIKKRWWSILKRSKNENETISSKKVKNISIEMIEEEVDKAINLINSKLPGADLKKAKEFLTLSGETMEKNDLSKSLHYSIQAQLAANPNTEYLLNCAQKADYDAQTGFNEGHFSKAIENWEIALDNYKLAEELAKARNQRDDLNTIHLLIEKIKRNIEKGKKSTQNRKIVEFISKGNSAIREGDNLFKKSDFLEAISRYNNAQNLFLKALEIAKIETFPENEKIEISLDTIQESIKASHFGYVNIMLENAGKDIQNNPERVESQYLAAIQYLNELDYPSVDVYSQLKNVANEGLIRSKILQADKKIKSGKKYIENREFHNSKEHYRSILQYLNNIYDEALELKFYQDIEDVKKLITVCNNYIDQARSAMLQVNEVEFSFETPNEILQGQARFDGEKLKNSNPSNNINYNRYNKTSPPQELFSRYSDIELIATGGFGKVYKVRRNDDLIVAVKIPANLDAETGNIFLREVENWTKIDKHINVVSIYDYNVVPFPYIEMEYCDNSLAELSKPVEPVTAARYIFDICEGLKIAHRRNIIHRDLKPQNILLNNNSIRIADWGLSKALSDASSSMTKEIKGTIKYAAPEQINDKKKDERTDIWQVGVLFYELITGTQPFTGDGFSEIASAISLKNPKIPSEYDPQLQEFDSIILKCLEKEPENRYRAVGELQKELAAYLSLSYTISFEKSITQKDIRTSAIFCVDLVITHLKINNLQKAYFYCDDLTLLIRGKDKTNIESLKNQIHLRIEEGFDDVPDELILLAERISDQISLGSLGVERKIKEGKLKFGHVTEFDQETDSLFE